MQKQIIITDFKLNSEIVRHMIVSTTFSYESASNSEFLNYLINAICDL
jgi:hypothetical protein